MSGPFCSPALRQFSASLLLTLGLRPTGPEMGMGMGAVAPEDLGLQISEAAPTLGSHISLAQRTTSLELARQAARGAWLRISAKVDGVVLRAKIFGKGKKLQERGVRFALEVLNRTPSFTSSLFSAGSPAPVEAPVLGVHRDEIRQPFREPR